MTKKETLRRLDEISRQYGMDDKKIAVSNLANKTLGLLHGKSGRLDGLSSLGFTNKKPT